MHHRDVDPQPVDPRDPGRPFGDLVLRTPPNWTAVGFLGMLGSLHLAVSVPTVLGGRWEGYLSLIFGSVFVALAGVAYAFRFELAVLPSRRRLRLRNGVGRACAERFIPFSSVRGVRLTLLYGTRRGRRAGSRRLPDPESRIELLCPYEDVLCPPTRVPRQEALFLAMALGVPLTKVTDEPPPPDDAGERLSEVVAQRMI